ncbi:MAG: beta-lactamase family protein [Candidatus Thermoplasmatota archaeon]|nr:beta-lactamase family protein [Candidatus Thermoplasmatota archaeon]MBS3801559.1 beta-lactamase family protein [Candidatus Thermoplasmatota archaeon]
MNLLSKNIRHVLILSILVMLFFSNLVPIYFTSAEEQKNTFNTTQTNSFPDEQYVNRLLKIANMPGFAVGIINKDGSVSTYNFGETKRNTDNTPTKNTVFLAASLTKTVTATAIMQLWEQGKIDLDDDINEYLPFPLRHPDHPNIPITIKMLLTHTGGFTNILWRTFLYFSFFHYPLDWYEYYLTPGNPFYHADNWNDYQPGDGIYYTSLGYDLLGYIVEQVSDIPFEEYCNQNIFEPLQMNNTTLRLNEINFDQLTTFYIHLLGIYIPIPYYEVHNDGSGGMYTTVEDTCHFLNMHMQQGSYMGTQLLQPETVEEMHTAQFPNLPSYDIYKDNRNYGYGWIIWPDENQTYQKGMQGHLGNAPGALASMTVLNDTGLVFFGNEWTRISYQQTTIMFMLREYFHTKTKPINPFF